MLVKVTQEDIDKGRRYSAWVCPLALALKRAYGTPHFLSVGIEDFAVQKKTISDIKTIPLPESAQLFRRDFDCERIVAPFEFEI